MSKTFGKGYCFSTCKSGGGKDSEKDYYMIVKGDIEQTQYDNPIYVTPYIQDWVRPHRLKVQKMKWVFKTTELVPMSQVRDKAFTELDEYVLVADETYKPETWYNTIYFDYVYDISEVSKYINYKGRTLFVHSEDDLNRLRNYLKN